MKIQAVLFQNFIGNGKFYIIIICKIITYSNIIETKAIVEQGNKRGTVNVTVVHWNPARGNNYLIFSFLILVTSLVKVIIRFITKKSIPARKYPMPRRQNAPRSIVNDTGSRPIVDSDCGYKCKFKLLDTLLLCDLTNMFCTFFYSLRCMQRIGEPEVPSDPIWGNLWFGGSGSGKELRFHKTPPFPTFRWILETFRARNSIPRFALLSGRNKMKILNIYAVNSNI